MLDRPRNMPARTGLGAAIVAMALVIQLAGADDVIAVHLSIPVEYLVWFLRIAFFVFPVVAFVVTRHTCIALQRADRRRLRRGMVFGVAAAPTPPNGHREEPDGERAPTAYLAQSRPLSEDERAVMETRRPDELLVSIPRHIVPLPTPRRAAAQLRARLNHFYVVSRLETPSAEADHNEQAPDGERPAADAADGQHGGNPAARDGDGGGNG